MACIARVVRTGANITIVIKSMWDIKESVMTYRWSGSLDHQPLTKNAQPLTINRQGRSSSNIRADSRLAPNKWETSLQSNAVSHWLDANPESALNMTHQLHDTGSVLLVAFCLQSSNIGTTSQTQFNSLIPEHRYVFNNTKQKIRYTGSNSYYMVNFIS